jgi:hypothetical protein
MARKESEQIFQELTSDKKNRQVDEHTKSKGQFKYLSWAIAVRELLKVDPEATWEVHEWGLDGAKQPYMQTQAGCFVKVTVWSGGIARTQVHPILDNRNASIQEPNAFQVNNSIQRCLAKAIALHGLGLYIYAGEDIPADECTDVHRKNLLVVAKVVGKEDVILKAIDDNSINEDNYYGALAKLQREERKMKENA